MSLRAIGNLNFFVIQWFFTRLAEISDDATGKVTGYKFIFRFPLTGWKWKEMFK